MSWGLRIKPNLAPEAEPAAGQQGPAPKAAGFAYTTKIRTLWLLACVQRGVDASFMRNFDKSDPYPITGAPKVVPNSNLVIESRVEVSDSTTSILNAEQSRC